MGKARIIIGMLGMDQHEVGAVTVSRMLMEAGMEVIYLGKFQSPRGIVKAAVEEGADMIGISCHSWEYLHFMPEILRLLEAQQVRIPVVAGGSVITGGDREKLLEMGVAAVFGAGAEKNDMMRTITELLGKETGHSAA